MKPTTFLRNAAAGSLVVSAALSLVSNLTAPEFPSGAAEQLRSIDEGGATSVVSAMTFTFAQLFLVGGLVAAAALVHRRKPILARVAAALVAVGAFGHSVFGGVSMVQLEMAADVANRTTYAGLVEDVESGPAVVFMALGLLGTVFGFVVLAVGLWRSHAVPGWIPAALGGFVVLEFVGTGISEWAGYASGVLYLGTLAALALSIYRSEVWSGPSVHTRSESQVAAV